jgi:flagellar basal body-associated protein FliL
MEFSFSLTKLKNRGTPNNMQQNMIILIIIIIIIIIIINGAAALLWAFSRFFTFLFLRTVGHRKASA